LALITCPECQGSLSTLAASCPHCGAVPAKAKNSTETTEKQIAGPMSGGKVFCGLLSFIGIIFIFIFFPIGVMMLITSGFILLFTKNKKVTVLVGKCPSCASVINLPKDAQGAPCPICKKPFLNRAGRFQEA
jgi:hypothetical protein